MLPTQLLVLGPCLRLFQNPDDLFFGESFPLHAEFSLVFLPENSLSKWTVLWGERQHWVGDSWLIVGNTALGVTDVRDMVDTIFGMRNFVQEISGTHGSWAAFGPKGTSKKIKNNMFTWLDNNWWG